MKLLVGLGNPGSAYEGTRHNVGFDALNRLACRAGSPVRRARFQGETAQATLRGNSVLLLWPLTWMNLSGKIPEPPVTQEDDSEAVTHVI